jgi:2-polyprenyl-6-methoxyphenol hydroxylase and related FAD-dependent oxidoreductases
MPPHIAQLLLGNKDINTTAAATAAASTPRPVNASLIQYPMPKRRVVDSRTIDVLAAGAGPTGLALAAELAANGIRRG